MTKAPAPLGSTLWAAFEAHSSSPALWISGTCYSYREVFQAASALAGLIEDRTEPGARVGILAQRSRIGYVGLLACLLAGRPYVPISMKFPLERQLAIASVAACAMFIVDAKSRRRFGGLAAALGDDAVAIVDEDLEHLSGVPLSDGAGQFAGGDETLAYVMFTSGTTGTPKGVAVRRENLAAYLSAIATIAPIRPGARCTQLFDLSFDLSVHDVFATWTSGGCLFVMDDEEGLDPVGFARRQDIECWFSVPSVVAMAKRLGRLEPGTLPDVRLSLFCGEPLAASLADDWAATAPNSRILNLYGPTEATIAIAAHEVTLGANPTSRPATVPLGRALPGSAVVVMGENGAPVAMGEVGELWLGGDQISDGYVNNEAENRSKFVERVIPGFEDGRWYRSGDLVRADSAHGLVFLGRVDDQIKIQGYRVELLEIEEALRHASGASEVAAAPWPTAGSAEGIVGFVCYPARSEKDIIAACRAKLPTYMAPKKIVLVDHLPLNANGKVDRLALHRDHLATL